MWEWIGGAVALLAAGAAFWQASEARAARKDAERSASDASASWGRIADVVEAQERRAAEEVERAARDPWLIERREVPHVYYWDFTLQGERPVGDIVWELEGGTGAWFDRKGLLESMHPGEMATLALTRRMGMPRSFTLWIEWQDTYGGPRHRKIVTLVTH